MMSFTNKLFDSHYSLTVFVLPANASDNFTDESLGDFLPGEIQTQVRKQEIISVGPHIIQSES